MVGFAYHTYQSSFVLTKAFEGSELALSQFISLMKSSPMLTRLAIGGSAIRPVEIPAALSSDAGPVTLPHLKALCLSDFGSPTILNAHLRLIYAPNLINLFMGDLDYSDDGHQLMDFASSFQFLSGGQGSFPLSSLESLELSAVRCRSSEAFERFVCGLTKLQRFHLQIGEHERGMSTSGLERRYLRAFLPAGGRRETISCPTTSGACLLLQEICLSGFGQDTILDIVVSRLPSIKYVGLDRRDGIDTSEIARWKELGVRIEVFSDVIEHRRTRMQSGDSRIAVRWEGI